MEHKKALLDSLAELRTSHDKASRAMAEIAATAARALKGGDVPTLDQLRIYAQALAQAQRQLGRCEDLLLGSPALGMSAEVASGRPYVH